MGSYAPKLWPPRLQTIVLWMTTVAFKMLMMKNVLLLTTLSVVHSDDAIAKEDESEEEEKILLTNDDTFSIVCGVVGFWGGVFVMGTVFLLMVQVKRVFKPE